MKVNVLAFLMVIIAFAACKTDPECECPARTIHLIGENNCKSENNCSCQHNIAGERVFGFPITNPENVDNFNLLDYGVVERVTAALNFIGGDKRAYIDANIKEIRIVIDAGATPYATDGVLIVGMNHSDYQITQALHIYTINIP